MKIAPMPAPRLSAIIVTCNRRRTLDLCLSQLARQSWGTERLEVLVVDDGSTDGTPEWLSAYAGEDLCRFALAASAAARAGVGA